MHSFTDIRIMAAASPITILGIDPGTVTMGYAIIKCTGQKIEMEHMSALRMSWTHDVFERLDRIYQTIDELIKQFRPNEFAIEAPFYGKNVQSMLKLGRAQGVAIACAMQHQLPVTEYSPKKVKQAITGNGNADKEQVWAMLQRITGLTDKPGGYDATDALGVAVCHYYQAHSAIGKMTGGKASGWDDFIRKNPGRIAGK
ncbi:MAG TPA: crossover junction endodeoxyribonuclease RuvC [Phnomibacter sp.]|nr:crossover junction endodeoxyribonuclease RuvC [Phnomibacter sp.]